MAPSPEPSLRERKKVRTRSAIQHHALRLFRERGYEGTTISQIAEAAEISESTFFRYFPTKEAVILTDDFDESVMLAFRAQPAGLPPLQALRNAMHSGFADITDVEIGDAVERVRLMSEVPELREAFAGQLLDSIDMAAEAIADRVGRPPGDLGVRTLAGAVVGAVMGVSFEGGRFVPDFLARIDAAIGILESGLDLSPGVGA